MVNYQHNEVVIEFTSKILKDNFVDLINKDNIRECIANINKLNICTLDIDTILSSSEVTKCDPVKDVVIQDIDVLKHYTNSNLANYNKWKSKPYTNGFTIENVASTPRSKHRIVVYDKKKELDKATNKPFLDTLSDKNESLRYFEDKVRIELNINTKVQIKKLLEIEDNRLMTVLSSDANPILTVMNKALKETSPNTYADQTMKQYHYELVLRDCDFDLGKVEANVRRRISKNSSVANAMKPYREYYHYLQQNSTSSMFDIRKLVV